MGGKPGSVFMTIHLGHMSPCVSCPRSLMWMQTPIVSHHKTLGVATHRVYHAHPITEVAVGSYPTLSPLPHIHSVYDGGLLSVALSLRLPPPAINRYALSV